MGHMGESGSQLRVQNRTAWRWCGIQRFHTQLAEYGAGSPEATVATKGAALDTAGAQAKPTSCHATVATPAPHGNKSSSTAVAAPHLCLSRVHGAVVHLLHLVQLVVQVLLRHTTAQQAAAQHSSSQVQQCTGARLPHGSLNLASLYPSLAFRKWSPSPHVPRLHAAARRSPPTSAPARRCCDLQNACTLYCLPLTISVACSMM